MQTKPIKMSNQAKKERKERQLSKTWTKLRKQQASLRKTLRKKQKSSRVAIKMLKNNQKAIKKQRSRRVSKKQTKMPVIYNFPGVLTVSLRFR